VTTNTKALTALTGIGPTGGGTVAVVTGEAGAVGLLVHVSIKASVTDRIKVYLRMRTTFWSNFWGKIPV
jgi:hypothetical protein